MINKPVIIGNSGEIPVDFRYVVKTTQTEFHEAKPAHNAKPNWLPEPQRQFGGVINKPPLIRNSGEVPVDFRM